MINIIDNAKISLHIRLSIEKEALQNVYHNPQIPMNQSNYSLIWISPFLSVIKINYSINRSTSRIQMF